jgi:hypothetical protein
MSYKGAGVRADSANRRGPTTVSRGFELVSSIAGTLMQQNSAANELDRLDFFTICILEFNRHLRSSRQARLVDATRPSQLLKCGATCALAREADVLSEVSGPFRDQRRFCNGN